MINENEKQVFLCTRLQRLGFAAKGRVKLYGEEFDLVSNPVPHGRGYGIDGVSRKSGSLRRVAIPVSLIQTIEHELDVMEETALAA
jgi:hypothetical protein